MDQIINNNRPSPDYDWNLDKGIYNYKIMLRLIEFNLDLIYIIAAPYSINKFTTSK